MLTFGGAAIGLLFLTDGFLFLDGSSGGFDTGGGVEIVLKRHFKVYDWETHLVLE